jgi:lipoprotein-releasing system permease protein
VTNPEKLYNIRYAYPASVFAIEKYYDENYVFIPIKLAEELTAYKNRRTSLEIELKDDSDPVKVKNELQTLLGSDFKVLQGEEQHEDLYKILRIEKLFVFIIFALVIAIASINIYFALTMLVIEKKKDIAILFAQGGTSGLIKRIFLKEGAIIAFSGSLVGLVLGLGISYAQEQYGLISMGLQTSIMNAYPVKIIWTDVLFSILTIILITFLASIQPAIKASKHPVLEEL